LGAPGAVGFGGCLVPADDPGGVAGLPPCGMVGRDEPDGGGCVDERCGPDGIVGVPGLDCAGDVEEADAAPGVPGADAPPDAADVPGIDAVPGVLGVDDAPPDVPDAPDIEAVPTDVPPTPGGLDVDADDEGAVVDGLTVAEGCGDGVCGGGAAGALNDPVDEFVFCGGTGADGGRTSTDRVNVRFSAA
jgi:hypothetical protein